MGQLFCEWGNGNAGAGHFPFCGGAELCRHPGGVGGAMGNRAIIPAQGLHVHNHAAQIHLVLDSGVDDLAVAGLGTICALLQIYVYAAVFLHNPKPGKVRSRLLLGDCGPVRFRRSCLEPVLFGNAGDRFRFIAGTTKEVVDKSRQVRSKLDLVLPAGLCRQRARVAGLRRGKTGPDQLFAKGGIS